jgi:hypothetical protein
MLLNTGVIQSGESQTKREGLLFPPLPDGEGIAAPKGSEEWHFGLPP